MTINNVTNVRADINEMLSKIREVSNKTNVFSGTNSVNPAVNNAAATNFESALSSVKDVFNSVNDIQANSEKIKTAYISGDSSVTMSQVVLASQKSKLAFEGLVTVRNKLLDAYKEIMNMPV